MATPSRRISSTASLINEVERSPSADLSDLQLTAAPGLLARLPEVSPQALKFASKLQASATKSDRVILVAGLTGQESSSEFAVQLAMGLSEIENQLVLLVDANLRNPSLHKEFGIELRPGLTNVLDGSARMEVAARAVKPTLAVLPAGAARPDSSVFTSTDFSAWLANHLRPHFRFTILTSASFNERVDAHLIASRTDGVIITVGAGKHRRSELLDLNGEMEALKAKVVGVVLCDSK